MRFSKASLLSLIIFSLSIVAPQWIGSGFAIAAADTLTVTVDAPGVKISVALYSLMTEEINHSYDGGLYAELIQNRAFKDGPRIGEPSDPSHTPHWELMKSGGASVSMDLDNSNPVNVAALPTSLKLEINGDNERIGVANDGYWGIPIKANTSIPSELLRALAEA